jgi:starvation-inducible DNA-binding protein
MSRLRTKKANYPGLMDILATLHAMRVSYQHSHWTSKGPMFFSRHQLFAKLYNSVAEELDLLAEKMVGMGGSYCIDLTQLVTRTAEICASLPKDDNLVSKALVLENMLQDLLKNQYELMKVEGSLTLGLDDFLMNVANNHETNQYLLKQTLAV